MHQVDMSNASNYSFISEAPVYIAIFALCFSPFIDMNYLTTHLMNYCNDIKYWFLLKIVDCKLLYDEYVHPILNSICMYFATNTIMVGDTIFHKTILNNQVYYVDSKTTHDVELVPSNPIMQISIHLDDDETIDITDYIRPFMVVNNTITDMLIVHLLYTYGFINDNVYKFDNMKYVYITSDCECITSTSIHFCVLNDNKMLTLPNEYAIHHNNIEQDIENEDYDEAIEQDVNQEPDEDDQEDFDDENYEEDDDAEDDDYEDVEEDDEDDEDYDEDYDEDDEDDDENDEEDDENDENDEDYEDDDYEDVEEDDKQEDNYSDNWKEMLSEEAKL